MKENQAKFHDRGPCQRLAKELQYDGEVDPSHILYGL